MRRAVIAALALAAILVAGLYVSYFFAPQMTYAPSHDYTLIEGDDGLQLMGPGQPDLGVVGQILREACELSATHAELDLEVIEKRWRWLPGPRYRIREVSRAPAPGE